MESLKRSVSYSQPNICASQAAINLAPLLAQLASVRRHFKAWAGILHNHLVLIGPVGEAGRACADAGQRGGCPLLLSTIWGPYLYTAWGLGKRSWGDWKALPQPGRSAHSAEEGVGRELKGPEGGRREEDCSSGFENHTRRSLPLVSSNSIESLFHTFPPIYFFKKNT